MRPIVTIFIVHIIVSRSKINTHKQQGSHLAGLPIVVEGVGERIGGAAATIGHLAQPLPTWAQCGRKLF